MRKRAQANAMDFPCVKCGLCCRLIKDIPALADYDKGNGVCRYLVGNLCAIYETRPAICNVKEMYNLWFKDALSWNDFIQENINACRTLMQKTAAV